MSYSLSPKKLSFDRSIEPNQALMFAGKRDDATIRRPVEVILTGQRGQSSQEKLNRDPAGASKAGLSNPQMVETAYIPAGYDTLIIDVGLRVMPNSARPSETNDPEAYRSYYRLTKAYDELGGFEILAARYVENIANGRFAWRNRTLSSRAAVTVSFLDKTLVFDPFALSPDEILGVEAMKAAVTSGTPDLVDELVAHFATGLGSRPVEICFSWCGDVLPNTQVYPSQDYKYSAEKADKGAPSRQLVSEHIWVEGKPFRQAAMNPQKIGAALRAIDDWHGDPFYGAIPVNPFGGVQAAGVALRHKNRAAPSLYDLNKRPELFTEALAEGTLSDNAHFFMANLVRGGVFGSSAGS